MSSMSGDQLQPDDTLEDQDLDDVLDEGYSPPEREPDHLRHPEGGESLDERLADEEPDVGAGDDPELSEERGPDDIVDGDVGGEIGEQRSGRLVAPDEGAREDDESALLASDEGIDGAAASAEEAAMHTIDDDEVF